MGSQIPSASMSTTNGIRARSAAAVSNAAGPCRAREFVERCSTRKSPIGTTPVRECSRLSVK